MERLTTGEAAKRLHVAKSTLKDWLDELPISAETDSRGRRRLDLEALAVLETVKDLRGQNYGYQTIRRRIVSLEIEQPDKSRLTADQEPKQIDAQVVASEVIAPIRPEIEQPDSDGQQPNKGRMTADQEPKAIDAEAIVSQVIAAIRTETAQSEKYARAAHQIGKLESENEHLRAQLAEAQKKIGLLEAPRRPWWKIWQ